MNNYYESLNDEVKEYFNILSPTFPEWLLDYIDTKEMQRIGYISMNCGTDYSKCFNVRYWYSNLDHSVGVALIIWNFTHDKKQTLAGLFHDIATPVFKHCIDFMNGDAKNQESTEERTYEIIKNSKEIMELLNRDNIKLEEVFDYKIYPIADNDMPKLSADRFEYNFSSGLVFFRVWDLERIRKIYNNIVVSKNEAGVEELVFKDKDICEEYITTVSKLWPKWIGDDERIVMQFLADMCKSMANANYLTVEDLYTLKEEEVIDKILNCEDKYLADSFKMFLNIDRSYRSLVPVEDKYSTNVDVKVRYVNPLVQSDNGVHRISDISERISKIIKEYLKAYRNDYYIYLDMSFNPYEEKVKVLKK